MNDFEIKIKKIEKAHDKIYDIITSIKNKSPEHLNGILFNQYDYYSLLDAIDKLTDIAILQINIMLKEETNRGDKRTYQFMKELLSGRLEINREKVLSTE